MNAVMALIVFLTMCFLSYLEEKQDLSLSISSNGSASITVSLEVNGIVYSGV